MEAIKTDETLITILFSSDSNLSCLFSWAARSSSWIFLVICSVLRMTSSVLGSVGSDSVSRSSSSGMELPSPSQPLLLSLTLLHKLQRENRKEIPAYCFNSVDKTAHYFTWNLFLNCIQESEYCLIAFPSSLSTNQSGWCSYPESSISESLNVLS